MKSLRSKFAKAKSQGFIRSAELLFTRFVPAWIFRYSSGNIYELNIEQLCANCPDLSERNLVFRCLEDPNSDAWQNLRAFTWNEVPAETTRNDIGYAIYDAESCEILAGVWVAKEDFQEEDLGFRAKLNSNQGWLYCAYVAQQARGRGIYKALLSLVAEHAIERGVSQLVCVVQAWNRISRMAHEKRSRWIVGWISSLRIGGFAWLSRAGNVTLEHRLVSNPANSPANIEIGEGSWKVLDRSNSSGAVSTVLEAGASR